MRRLTSAFYLLVTSLFFLVSCAEQEAGSNDSQLAGKELRFASPNYTIQPGEERYLCYTMDLPEKIIVKGFTPEYGPGTHHVVLSYTTEREPESAFDCPMLHKDGWIPLYIGGFEPAPLQYPDGAGVRLGKGQQLLMQVHVTNATTVPITAHSALIFQLSDPDAAVEQAGVFGLTNEQIHIGAEPTTVEMKCLARRKMNVFAVFPHMHDLGESIELSVGDTPLYSIDGWDSHQDIQLLGASVPIDPTDTLSLRCTYHGSPKPVQYGSNADDEMCVFVLYYTPFQVLDGCRN